MKPKISILDYGVGNLRSVRRGLESKGAEAFVTNERDLLLDSDAMVLPGVGAFCDAMTDLTPFMDDITSYVKEKPLLGICLGLQLLFTESEEDGLHQGMDLMKGRIVRLPETVKIPQMGWNSTKIKKGTRLLKGLQSGAYFYYVHSYYAIPDGDVTTATTTYGVEVPAVVEEGNVYATQFHPEKSGSAGLTILENFVELARRK